MLLKQEFKTLAGAQKRAAFENAHCDKRYLFTPVRCFNGVPDPGPYMSPSADYTWRLKKESRTHAPTP